MFREPFLEGRRMKPIRIKSNGRPANERAKAVKPGRRTRDKKLARLGTPIGKSKERAGR